MKPHEFLVLISFVLMALDTAAEGTGMRIEMDTNHLERLIKANAAVYAKKDNVDSDPFKPSFHLMPMAGGAGDPNGPIFAKGKYHMFFQHAPEMEWGKPVEEWNEYHGTYNHTGWGHVSSTDLVYWEHEPIALMPELGSYDPNLCASGSAVIDDEGVPIIFYTAAEPQTQCIARSYDPNLRHWLKDKNNPILLEPEYPNYSKGGFRDPFLWREGTTWQMIVCGAIKGVGGTALHFQSKNLTDWEFRGPFCVGNDPHCLAWEVPNFLTFNDAKTGMLIVSPLYDNLQDTDHNPRNNVLYTIAPYGGNGDFTPGDFKKLDIAHPNDFYAALSMKAPDGRWIMWAMNIGGSTEGHHWATHLSLPRVLDVRSDGLLSQEPILELQGLRRDHWGITSMDLAGEFVLEPRSVTCEVVAEIEMGDAKRIGLDMRASDDFETRSRVYFDVEQKRFHIGNYDVDFELLEDEQILRIHVFVDHGVMETFVNGRECGTLRPYNDLAHQSMRLFSEGGTAWIRSVDVWEMGSIWERPEPDDGSGLRMMDSGKDTVGLKIPRVSKPWSEALRLVGDGKTMYSDFGLIRDKPGRWHCIGTFGTDPDGKGDGRALSDGYTLFHGVGDTLDAPMQHLDKIPYQVDSPRQAVMWAPGLTWDTEGERAFLYYFHYFGWEEGARVLPDEQAVRLLVSDSPDLKSWRPYDGLKLSNTNVVFRELDARDFRVLWDERLSVYFMYYCSSLASGPRVRTSSDLLHWSEPVTVLTASPADPHGYAESPFVLYRDGYYYLWVSGIDYSHTSLYISEDPFNFGDAIENRIEDTPGHAPEIITVDGKDHMACSMVSTVPSESPGAHDLNGILIQPLRWDEADPGMEQRKVRKTQGE